MAKHQQDTRVVVDGKRGAIEQRTSTEDNFLPSAEELSKLKDIDSTAIDWIKSRTEKEQDARINFNKRNMDLAHKEVNFVGIALFMAFLLSVLILGAAAFFVYLDKEVFGSIFGGVGIFVCVQSFLRFGQRKK
ncbi:MAG: hypothetical protein LBG17_02895 [Bacteroidales bacterium]|jgi:uncharacterized membrane protein|nr:hypothetical protein [Bacteroidales bacterium]